MINKKLCEIGLEASQLSLHLHQRYFFEFFNVHASGFEQVDDVLVAINQL